MNLRRQSLRFLIRSRNKVAQLNLQKGLADLADKYRARLGREGRLDIPAEEVWAELRRIREEVAERDYPN